MSFSKQVLLEVWFSKQVFDIIYLPVLLFIIYLQFYYLLFSLLEFKDKWGNLMFKLTVRITPATLMLLEQKKID